MNGCSAVHLTVFGLNPVVKFGTDRLKDTFLPRAAAGDLHVAFGVTEPDAGTDTGRISTRAEPDGNGGWKIHGRKIWTTKALESEVVLLIARTGDKDSGLLGLSLFLADLDPDYVDIRAIPKVGRNAVASCEVAYDGLPVEWWRLLGEENKGFKLLLHGLNPERVLLASEACGIGEVALDRAITYAKERIVFDRPIGANQAISHPIAHAHAQLRAAWMMALHAGRRYDAGLECGEAANTAKYLAAEASFYAADRAVQTLGGMGYATRVPRRAVLARGAAPAHRAGDAGDDAQLPRAERARPAPQLLRGPVRHARRLRRDRLLPRRLAHRRPLPVLRPPPRRSAPSGASRTTTWSWSPATTKRSRSTTTPPPSRRATRVTGPFPGFPVALEGDDVSDLIEQHRDALPMSDQLIDVRPARSTPTTAPC